MGQRERERIYTYLLYQSNKILNLLTKKERHNEQYSVNIRKFDNRREKYFISEEGGREESSLSSKAPKCRPLLLLTPVALTRLSEKCHK